MLAVKDISVLVIDDRSEQCSHFNHPDIVDTLFQEFFCRAVLRIRKEVTQLFIKYKSAAACFISAEHRSVLYLRSTGKTDLSIFQILIGDDLVRAVKCHPGDAVYLADPFREFIRKPTVILIGKSIILTLIRSLIKSIHEAVSDTNVLLESKDDLRILLFHFQKDLPCFLLRGTVIADI